MKKRRRKPMRQRAAAGMLGKEITRRSRGRCELCEGREGVRLFELEPFPVEPSPDRTLMACEPCRLGLEGRRRDLLRAGFLNAAVWSEEPAVRLAACRLALCLDLADDPLLESAMEVAGFDTETGEMA